jgi:hypothetical protein
MDHTDGSNEKPTFRPEDAKPFLECDRRWKPDWLIKPLIQRYAVNILLGAPKQRKSTFRAHLLAAMLTGEPACGHFPVERTIQRALVCLGEENEHAEATRLARSIRGVGADPEAVGGGVRIMPPLKFYLDGQDQINKLMAYVESEQVDLVVFDPMVGFHMQEENSSGGMHRVMQYMRWLTRATTVVIVHHTAKPQANQGKVSLGYRARGSSAIPGAYDVGMLLDDGPNGLKKLEIEARYDQAEPVLLSCDWADPEAIVWKAHENETATEMVLEKLGEHGGWCRVSYLATETGNSRGIVGKVVQDLAKAGQIESRERKGKGGVSREYKLKA